MEGKVLSNLKIPAGIGITMGPASKKETMKETASYYRSEKGMCHASQDAKGSGNVTANQSAKGPGHVASCGIKQRGRGSGDVSGSS